ncbi:hypothetical protein HGRIS_014870 [Hohenbuehelia grisea]|uniref:HAMP domain-containing protein n=1 Tax=Hohenbuehelia grisea TaxID=104357 RepID=A0ABR3IR12_9AGAR
MAMNLTNQVRSIAQVTKAVAGGDLTDLTKKIEVDARGDILELRETFNGMTESVSVFADEVTREVGTEGRFSGHARVTNVGGTWKDLTDNVNVMATAVACGDWTQKIAGVSVSGEMLNLVNTINEMIDQMAIFAAEVKNEGRLGVQAEVGDV